MKACGRRQLELRHRLNLSRSLNPAINHSSRPSSQDLNRLHGPAGRAPPHRDQLPLPEPRELAPPSTGCPPLTWTPLLS